MASGEQQAGEKVWLTIAVLLIAVVATRALWFGNPAATTDEQLYHLIGARLADGALPYVDLWDRKPFGLFALFALGESIGGPGPEGFQILAALFTLGGSWLTYRLARLQVDWITATGAGVLYAVLISLYGGYSGQSEVFHVPLMLVMAWLVFDLETRNYAAHAALAMFIGGLALQVKYTVLPQCLFFGLVALWNLHRRSAPLTVLAGHAAIFALLGLLPTIAVGAIYYFAGEFPAFWFANFESFFEREGAGRFLSPVRAGLLPLAGLMLAGLYLALRGNAPRDRLLYGLTLGWALAAAATVFLPGTVYLYYFGALAAPAVLVTLPLLDRGGPMKWSPLALVLGASIWLLGPIADWKTSREETASLAAMAEQIAPLVDDSEECLWVHDGPTALYRLSDSCLPTRFVYPDHLNNALEDRGLGIAQTVEVTRILSHLPPVIVTSDEPLTRQNNAVGTLLDAALAIGYVELTEATSGYRRITAYKRRDLD